jgi:HpcH/HpaI aldolase/citrate lyase family
MVDDILGDVLILEIHVAIAPAFQPHRACLSVPASSARMQAKAVTLDADQVLFDLEDATAPSEKAGARALAVES